MRGVQEVRRPLVYLLGANAPSAVASPFLVYGLDLGVEGSAIANVLAQAAAAALFVRALLPHRRRAAAALARDARAARRSAATSWPARWRWRWPS